ncbi:alpha-glucoside transport system substrate-binding protein [Microbacteriaceae bacterium SG_E_30_P1]|uniref:Alpha-glucoside transport system substrate-binding protein n=1 Tax=Antiquaquibacter oligotrophicus TaxID=2880260 RepID=A0ABT6KPL3_9MICO|nr:extracellular solute-binding protein [Antiquaquibacter oligotrophicus]MDH6181936.1 alpha-glucoside transport system substrate-binding protein [Antiquaquibacter oligotrophicus]UDF12394.1 extracellular solute-binding protein [Antiquaquibacter oligotrophicus]
MSSTLHRRWILPAAAASFALVLAGCAGGGSGPSADVDCADYEQYGTFENESVEIYATIIDVEADQIVESWADFEACTGITIDYVGTQEAETQINVRAAAGDAPDIMIVPQPGLLQRLIADGYVVPAAQSVEDNVDEFWSESWKGYGTVDGTFYAAPLMASVKGWVWYSPADFEANGYEVPETWDDLMALTEDMAANNTATYKPWCVGFGSGDATGWPGTDWIEDLVLRTAGPEAYDQWVAGELKFDSPEIREAFDLAGEILLNPDYVNGGFGGVDSIVSTTFNDGGLPILDGNCSLHHQASFYEAQWPEGTVVAPDGDVWAFITPKMSADDPESVTGGGEFVAAFTESDAVTAVQTYLSSDTWANNRVALGGVISANKGLDPELAGSELGKASIEILQGEDTVFRFDGSDLMPAAVGTSSFWTGMVDWIVGTRNTDEVLTFIDSTYP